MTGQETFTGHVDLVPLAEPHGESCLTVYEVTFDGCARTHWHTHPRGQGLYVTRGVALVQIQGETPVLLCPGESLWTPPDTRHWHGAATGDPMTHIAYQDAAADGTTITWHDAVTDTTYRHAQEEAR